MVDTRKSHANEPSEAVSERLEVVQAVQAGIGAQRWAAFLILQLALIAGALAVLFAHSTSDTWPIVAGGVWQIIFIASAAMSIGFGAAMLLYGRLGSRQAALLDADYQALVAQADSLLNSSSIRSGEKEANAVRAS